MPSSSLAPLPTPAPQKATQQVQPVPSYPTTEAPSDWDAALACQTLGYGPSQYNAFKQELAAAGTPAQRVSDYLHYLADASDECGANLHTGVSVGAALVQGDSVERAEQNIRILTTCSKKVRGALFEFALTVVNGQEEPNGLESYNAAIMDVNNPRRAYAFLQVIMRLRMRRH